MELSNKREQLITAGISLFTRNGFDATSIQDIAREAGVAKGTVYLYFRSKDELVNEVFKHCYQMDVEACRQGMDEEKNALDKLCRRLDNIVEFALGHPLEAKIEALYCSSPRYCPDQHACQMELYEDIGRVMEEGVSRGELRALPIIFLSELYYGITKAMYHLFQQNPDKWQDAQTRRECYDIIRDGFSI